MLRYDIVFNRYVLSLSIEVHCLYLKVGLARPAETLFRIAGVEAGRARGACVTHFILYQYLIL